MYLHKSVQSVVWGIKSIEYEIVFYLPQVVREEPWIPAQLLRRKEIRGFEEVSYFIEFFPERENFTNSNVTEMGSKTCQKLQIKADFKPGEESRWPWKTHILHNDSP